jgi:endonuclease YncB( thermonuclease family)
VGSLFFIFLFSLSPIVLSQDYYGRVVGITDGDTFTFITQEKRQVKVRLSEIDTPEKNQPYGTRAKRALSDLVFGKEIHLRKSGSDRYGRLLGDVYVGHTHINRVMIQVGMAWVYRQYMEDPSLLMDEKKAQESKIGIWSQPRKDQVPPWDWRRGIRSNMEKPVIVQETGLVYNCEGKTKCSEMVSCEEALYYLTHCGVGSLDGDMDGLPCEKICK